MARVNITIADELLRGARAAELNVSQVSAAALEQELDRLAKLAELESYLMELGLVSPTEQQAARDWADRELGEAANRGA